jgi:DNA-directed RNA polymerase subunit M/transcription elongation factor TFIIS
MQATDCREISSIATRKSVPTCTSCGDTEFTHQDREFGGTMTRIVFCTSCGASIGVVIAI